MLDDLSNPTHPPLPPSVPSLSTRAAYAFFDIAAKCVFGAILLFFHSSVESEEAGVVASPVTAAAASPNVVTHGSYTAVVGGATPTAA